MGNYYGRTYGFAKCGICGKSFEKKSGNSKYCSQECYLTSHGQTGIGLSPRPCQECGQTINSPTGPTQKYCIECSRMRRLNARRENNGRERLEKGIIPIGGKMPCAGCGVEIIRTSGFRKYCAACITKRDRERFKRYVENHPDKVKGWTDNAYSNYHFGGNRERTLARDNHTCQICGGMRRLHVHHLDGNGTTMEIDERNNDISNLITLCGSCHATLHNHVRWKHVSLREAFEITKNERQPKTSPLF